jgi:predicted ATPase
MALPTSALERITIDGYKSIKHADIELRELNILIGANGAGKSNFISLFRMFAAIVGKRLQSYVATNGGANSLLFQGPKVTKAIHVKLEFGENLYECSLTPDAEGALFFDSETAYVWDKSKYERPYNVDLGAGHRESHLDQGGNVGKYTRDKIGTWTLYHFHDTGPTAGVKQLSDISDNAALRGDAGNLPAFLMLIRDRYATNYKQIVDAVRLAAPFFDDFVLRPNPYDPTKTRLEWKQKGSDSTFGAGDFSDGTLRFVCLATALLQPKPPTTIVIDEPELGLHPFAITLLSGLMRSTSQRRQIIVSTQSVPLVNQFVPEDLVVVDRHGAESTFRRLESESLTTWLEGYGLGDLWEKNVLGGRPSYA